MTTLKIKFRPSAVEGREGTVYIQLTHLRATRQISTGCHIMPCEWSAETGSVDVSAAATPGRRAYLLAAYSRVMLVAERVRAAVAQCARRFGACTVDDIVGCWATLPAEVTMFGQMRAAIARLSQLGRVRTAEAYTSALSSFMRFRGGSDILLSDVSGDIMVSYEEWLKASGLCPNTTSFYMRILRAVYNRAVDSGGTRQGNPFRRVYTGVGKTVKRAVPPESIRGLRCLDLTDSAAQCFARDMFLFAFYTRGMSFIDIAYLRKRDLADGILTYRRRKTGQRLTIKWEMCMEEIRRRHPGADGSPYLLDIIAAPGRDERTQYRNAARRINNALKAVGRRAGIGVPLTMYCVRHAWASIARSKNIPLRVISEGMGHDSEETTRIYLASLDAGTVDRANSLIIRSV